MGVTTQPRAAASASGGVLRFRGGTNGVMTGHPKVYLVFWGSQWGTQSPDNAGDLSFSNDPIRAATLLQRLFRGLGTGGEMWSGVMTQYCDEEVLNAVACLPQKPHVLYPTGGVLAGAWYDGDTAAPHTATRAQLGGEAVRAAGHFGNTSAALNRDAQYIILSASGQNPGGYLDSHFCSWHDWTGNPQVGASGVYGDLAFTNLPYVMDLGGTCGGNFVNPGPAGVMDAYTLSAGFQYADMLTDPFPSGGWTDDAGLEVANKCEWIPAGQPGGAVNVSTATGVFALPGIWSNNSNSGAGGCVTSEPRFALQILTLGGDVTTKVNRPLSLQLAAAGGTPPYRWSVSGLPAGTAATPAGLISGSPTAVGVFPVSFTVTDTEGTSVSGGLGLTVADLVTREFVGRATAPKPPQALTQATSRAFAAATAAGYSRSECEVTDSPVERVGSQYQATVTVSCTG